MTRINEANLDDYCGHRGMLEYVKLFRLADPRPWVPDEGFEEALVDQLAKGTASLARWIDPNFCTAWPFWRMVLWVGVAVNGEEHVAVLSVRNAETVPEQHMLIEHPRENRSVLAVGLHKDIELTYDADSDVFLSVPLEDGPRITSTMSGVKTNFH